MSEQQIECPTVASLARLAKLDSLELSLVDAPSSVRQAMDATWSAENAVFLESVPLSRRGAAEKLRYAASIVENELLQYEPRFADTLRALARGEETQDAVDAPDGEAIYELLRRLAAQIERDANLVALQSMVAVALGCVLRRVDKDSEAVAMLLQVGRSFAIPESEMFAPSAFDAELGAVLKAAKTARAQ